MIKAWIKRAKDAAGGWCQIEENELPDQPVTIAVSHSAVNFKDALALSGRAPIFRAFPMVAGVDLAGTVVSDRTGRLKPGTRVVATGHGMGEVHWGAYAELARLPHDFLTEIPAVFSLAQAAAIGTAGVTAAMAVNALTAYGLTPGNGSILVTGPSGGVGGMALALLSKAGFSAIAATGRPAEESYLRQIGASEIVERAELMGETRPLAKERWQGAIDVAGGTILANILSHTLHDGAVAACGLAQSMALPGNVAPFILRGIALFGINSVTPPPGATERAWQRLARDLDPQKLALMTVPRFFDEVDGLAAELLDQHIRGRVVLSWR